MSYKSLISLMAACAILAVAGFPAGIAVAKKKSGDDQNTSTACTTSLGAFPGAETEDEPNKKPSGKTGKKSSGGKSGATDDDDCVVGALPKDATNN